MKKYCYKCIIFLAVFCLFLPLENSLAKEQAKYASEGIAFHAYPGQSAGTLPVYRFVSSKTGEHYYAFSNTVPKNYRSESVAFYAYPGQSDGTLPVYRFLNSKNSDHFYVMSSSAPDTPKNYKSEGIAFYAYPGQTDGTLPVYRFFKSTNGDHFYTISESEKNSLMTSSSAGSGSLGPEIAVGLWYISKSETFRIDANKGYNIKDGDGNVIAQVAGDSTTKVDYDDDGKLEVSGSIASTMIDDKVVFDAADGDNSSIIFNAHRPDDSYDHFRGKIEVNYYHGDDIYGGNSSTVSQIWIINKLPLEQYVWGMGETTGTGDTDHVRVMTTIFRTYGDWYIENATKYKPLGFKIRSDSGSQIYGGYDWEKDHPNIKSAADDTRGKIVRYKGEVALTPYCSYTDGKTRKLNGYPYLKSVKDHKKGTKKGLKPGEGGNHMWGLSAHGALGYAQDGKSWTWILRHYYTKVKIESIY